MGDNPLVNRRNGRQNEPVHSPNGSNKDVILGKSCVTLPNLPGLDNHQCDGINGQYVLYIKDHLVLWCNDALKDLIEKQSDEIIGTACYRLLFDRNSPCSNCPTSHSDGGLLASMEFDRGGNRSNVYCNTLKNKKGRPVEHLMVIHDPSPGTLGRMGRSDLEARVRPFIETLPDFVGILDRQGRVLYSHPFQDNTERREDSECDIVGILKPDRPETLKSLVDFVFTDGKSVSEEIEVQSEGRDPIRYGVSLWPISDGDRVVSAYVVAKNSTWERESIDAIIEVEKKFNTIFHDASLGIVLTDGNGVIQDANPASSKILGRSRDQLVSTKLVDYVISGDGKDIEGLFIVSDERTRDVIDIEIRAKNGDGRFQWLHMNITPNGRGGGEPGCLIMIEDITKRRSVEEDLAKRIEFERTLNEISSKLINIDETDIDAEIIKILSWVAGLLNADASFVFVNLTDSLKPMFLYRWSSDAQSLRSGEQCGDEIRSNNSTARYWPEYIELLTPEMSDNTPFNFQRIHVIRSNDLGSILMRPLFTWGTIRCYLGTISLDPVHQWRAEDNETLQSVGQVLSFALHRVNLTEDHSIFFNQSSDLLGIYDLGRRRFSKINTAFAKFLSMNDENIHDNLLDLIYPSDLQRFEHYVQECKGNGTGTPIFRMRFISTSGDIKWTVMHCHLSHNNNDVYCVGRDITENKRRDIEVSKRTLKFHLNEGEVYLETSGLQGKLIEMIHDFIRVGYLVHYFGRNPSLVLKDFDMDMVRVHWLAESDSKRATHPRKETILSVVEDVPKNAVIIIDRFDYLIFKQGFKEALAVVQCMREIAYVNEQIVLISIDPTTVSSTHLHHLEKECSVLKHVHEVKIPNELLQILKVVRALHMSHQEITYRDLLERLSVSKPTLRKRIGTLVYLGYIEKKMSGRRMCFLPTEKSLNLLLGDFF